LRGKKFLQQSLVSEWGESHNRVSWRDVEKPELPSPSEINPSSGQSDSIESN